MVNNSHDEVDQSDEKSDKLGATRRSILAAGSIAGLGLSTGSVSGQSRGRGRKSSVWADSNGDQLLEPRDGFEGIDVDVAQIAELDDVHHAQNFQGANGGEQIQNAIDTADADPGPNVVRVGPEGPDDDGQWNLTDTISLPSNTMLILYGSYLFLEAGTNEVMFTNSDHEDGNSDIQIAAHDATIDANGENQVRQAEQTAWRRNAGVFFENVDRLQITGLLVTDTNQWGMAIHDVRNSYFSNITFDQPPLVNRDGLHLVGPIDGVIADGLYGRTDDDAVIADAGGNESDTDGSPQGPIENVLFTNINVEGYGNHGGAKVLGNGEYTVRNVKFENCVFHNRGDRALRILAGQSDNPPSGDDISNIEFSNIISDRPDDGNQRGLVIEADCVNVMVNGMMHTGGINSFVDVVPRDGPVTVDHLEINDVLVEREASGVAGTFVHTDSNTKINNLIVNSADVRNIDRGFYIEGEANGIVDNYMVEGLANTPYSSDTGDTGEFKLTTNCAPAEGPVDGLIGSTPIASPGWDPDGDGNGEVVCYDGEAYQEVVDLPNYT